MNQLQLLSPGRAAGATRWAATTGNKLLAVIGMKRSFDTIGNEHLKPLGNGHTLVCDTDNNGDVHVEPRSGGDASIKSIVKSKLKSIVKRAKGVK